MDTKYLYRSQLDNSTIVALLISSILFVWFCHFPPFGISVWLLILIGVLFYYLILAIFQSRYYFYDEHVMKIFIFRPFYRKTAYRYEQLYKVKYKHIGAKGEQPKFIVYQKKKQYLKYFNYFLFHKHSRRVEIVAFLLSKNVQMEVRSDFEKKDREIIDMVKKKYPKNIRLHP